MAWNEILLYLCYKHLIQLEFESSVMQINVKLLGIKLFKDETKWKKIDSMRSPPQIRETIVSPIYTEYSDNKFIIIAPILKIIFMTRHNNILFIYHVVINSSRSQLGIFQTLLNFIFAKYKAVHILLE